MKLGIDVFFEKEFKKYQDERLGILCNPASCNSKLEHIRDLALKPKHKLNVTCFFGPQHGIRGEKQDNMIESSDFIDPISKVPVFSLYSSTREPQATHMEKIDTLIVDLQDIGTRIYTFMYTLANCMKAAKKFEKKVVVLDRPNPIGNLIEGNCLEPKFSSFVGQFPIPVRHGMSMGELAILFNDHFKIDCDLKVIKFTGLKKDAMWEPSNWVPPSPNIPTLRSCLLFPITVYFEGTNISEGRGTTKPFEWIGAPFLDPDRLAAQMNTFRLPGLHFRPIFFQPTFHKWKEQNCGGVQIHVLDPKKVRAFPASLRLFETIYEQSNGKMQWKNPPYEYEYEKKPIDLIWGTDKVRLLLEGGQKLHEFEKESLAATLKFKSLSNSARLY